MLQKHQIMQKIKINLEKEKMKVIQDMKIQKMVAGGREMQLEIGHIVEVVHGKDGLKNQIEGIRKKIQTGEL